ncbi:bifunctional oligoribonuclease/PAP phosphatase NrnA [Paenibacillus sp. 481]|nr:bifunctional oligoribonuclease/PAP phosphatase NrnA [Paenibacillus sp. 481]
MNKQQSEALHKSSLKGLDLCHFVEHNETLADYVQALEKALAFIRACSHSPEPILVVAHVQPDGDAISSTLAVGWLLQQWNLPHVMVNENGVHGRLTFLHNAEQIREYGHPTLEGSTFRNVICVDCADYSRVGKIVDYIAEDANVLNIDHHPTNDRYGQVALIREDAAATTEILFDLLQYAQVELDKDVSTALYTGLLTDTGGFRYSNTTPHVMATASQLLKRGVNGNDIADRLLEKMSLSQIQIIQRGLARLAFSVDNQISWLYVTPEDMQATGAANEDLEGLVNYPRNIEGVEVGILFKQVSAGAVKVSMRSAGKVNVAAVAQQFGGGGHVRAAGCRIEGELSDVIQMVVERVSQAL